MADSRYMLLETRVRQPSVVFYLVDDFTGNVPLQEVRVTLVGSPVKPVMNKSGYYVFLNLPDGKHSFNIESDHFRREVVTVTTSLAAGVKTKSIQLVPLPSYPFPAGATLIRGMVLEKGTDLPLGETEIKINVKGEEIKTGSTPKGEFIFCFPRLKLAKTDPTVLELTPVFSKGGYQDDEMFLIKDGTVQKTDKIGLAIGKETKVKKYLKKS